MPLFIKYQFIPEGKCPAEIMLIATSVTEEEGQDFIQGTYGRRIKQTPRYLKGPSGCILSDLLMSIGINIDEQYYTAIIKWLLPKQERNKPKRIVLDQAMPIIRDEIERVAPKIIVVFGKAAAARHAGGTRCVVLESRRHAGVCAGLYVAGITKPKTAALHVGTAVHSVLKAWNKARWKSQPPTLKQLHDEFSKAWADNEGGPVKWDDGEEAEEIKTGWRLVETYIRESKIPESLKPDAVEVPVEADLHHHGLPKLIGVQISSYAVLYREATGKRENGIELHHFVKTKSPKLVMTTLEPMSDAQQSRLFRLNERVRKDSGRRTLSRLPACSARVVSSLTNAGRGAEVIRTNNRSRRSIRCDQSERRKEK